MPFESASNFVLSDIMYFHNDEFHMTELGDDVIKFIEKEGIYYGYE